MYSVVTVIFLLGLVELAARRWNRWFDSRLVAISISWFLLVWVIINSAFHPSATLLYLSLIPRSLIRLSYIYTVSRRTMSPAGLVHLSRVAVNTV